jgi:hypothetical protein
LAAVVIDSGHCRLEAWRSRWDCGGLDRIRYRAAARLKHPRNGRIGTR